MRSKGSINKRIINGKSYYYYQYIDNGKLISKSIGEAEAYNLANHIYFPGSKEEDFFSHKFNLNVIYGKSLYLLSRDVSGLNKRFCYDSIDSFINSKERISKLLILYGLRRTGKTTLMLQTINELNIKEFMKAAYIKCNPGDNFYKLLDDVNYLIDSGFRYIYIDEITLLEDFVILSSTLSDIYGLMAKIVISGTDSLGFLIASRNSLYDRAILLHTTYISFKEFATVLGNRSIDKYIEYGGTMSMEGVDYNKTISTKNGRVNEYIDSAISHNIVHSLKMYKDGTYFASLYELYERNELENIINRIVEDTNHRFAISVIENDFRSHDYGSLKQLTALPNNFSSLGGVLNEVDEKKLIDDLMKALNIINKDKQTYKIDSNVLVEIEEYLSLLDVYSKVKEVNYPSYVTKEKNIITQPGLRYSQAKELLKLLLNEPSINQYKQEVIDSLENKLLSDIKGRMIEEIALLETSKNGIEAFKFTFGPLGEYDMVILDKVNRVTDLYEIKYSSTIDERQTKFLLDNELIQKVEDKYYPVRNKYVLYNGESKDINGIKYLNIGEYLLAL